MFSLNFITCKAARARWIKYINRRLAPKNYLFTHNELYKFIAKFHEVFSIRTKINLCYLRYSNVFGEAFFPRSSSNYVSQITL